jgi:hypothetical protein
MSAAEVARLDTWMLEIAAQARGDGREEASGDWRFGDNDALIVHLSGFWHDFSADEAGHGALSLLAHLRGGAEGANIARAWLAQHEATAGSAGTTAPPTTRPSSLVSMRKRKHTSTPYGSAPRWRPTVRRC